MVIQIFKRLAAKLPNSVQDELKRWHFARQIRNHAFATAEPEYAMLEEWISHGDWVVDVGANVGHYSVKMSASSAIRAE
jgi:expansin (peptidoglycan-binding protein)